jgi:hypothetical protein
MRGKSELQSGSRARLHNEAARLALQEAEAYMHRANTALCTAIEALGVRAAPMLSGCFDAELDTDATGPEQGIIGRIKGVNTAAIHEAVAEGAVPVVAALATVKAPDAEHDPESSLTFSTWAASAALARDLKPLKIVVLRPDGGFLNPGKPMLLQHGVLVCSAGHLACSVGNLDNSVGCLDTSDVLGYLVRVFDQVCVSQMGHDSLASLLQEIWSSSARSHIR